MSRRRLVSVPRWVPCLALLVAALGLSPAPSASAAVLANTGAAGVSSTQGSATFETAVLRNVNRVRAAHGLRRVRHSDCLDGLAGSWAVHLADIGALVHRDQAVVVAKCSLSWAGEDLGSGSDLTPRKIVRAWMHSPAHRKVLLKPRARRGAVGAALSTDDVRFVVLNLGDPT